MGCRFCGKDLAGAADRCPHCGGRVARDRRAVAPLEEPVAGRGAEIDRLEREARWFLVGTGVLLLVLWTSASLTGTRAFRKAGDDASLFYWLIVYRHPFGLVGAGLLACGLAFWATRRLAFAHVGGAVWFAFVLWPLALAGPTGLLAMIADGEVGVSIGRGGLRPESPLLAIATWVIFAAIPLYYFRQLGRLRRGEPVSEG